MFATVLKSQIRFLHICHSPLQKTRPMTSLAARRFTSPLHAAVGKEGGESSSIQGILTQNWPSPPRGLNAARRQQQPQCRQGGQQVRRGPSLPAPASPHHLYQEEWPTFRPQSIIYSLLFVSVTFYIIFYLRWLDIKNFNGQSRLQKCATNQDAVTICQVNGWMTSKVTERVRAEIHCLHCRLCLASSASKLRSWRLHSVGHAEKGRGITSLLLCCKYFPC